jgi:hypothetical protein
MELRINILCYFSLLLPCSTGLSVLSSLFSSFLFLSSSSFLSLSSLSFEPEDSPFIQLLYKTVLPVAIVTTLLVVSNIF